MTRVEFFVDDAGEHRWRVKASNGEVVAQGEGHGSESDAVRAFVRMARLVAEARARLVRVERSE